MIVYKKTLEIQTKANWILWVGRSKGGGVAKGTNKFETDGYMHTCEHFINVYA